MASSLEKLIDVLRKRVFLMQVHEFAKCRFSMTHSIKFNQLFNKRNKDFYSNNSFYLLLCETINNKLFLLLENV